MNMLLFGIVWVLVMALVTMVAGRRIIRTSGLSRSRSRQAWGALIALVAMPLGFFLFAMRRVSAPWADTFGWVAYIALGLFSYLLAFALLRDLFVLPLWLRRRVMVWRSRRSGTSPDLYDPARRQFLYRASNIGIVTASVASTGLGLFEAHGRITVEEVAVPIADLPAALEGLSIIQFSDLHIGPTIKRPFVERVVDTINSLRGDLIVFTGDLVDGSVGALHHDAEPLAALAAPLGKWFVTGNHEYYSGAPAWIEEAKLLGFTVLMNEHAVLKHRGGRFVLAGVTDYTAGQFYKEHRSSPSRAVEGAPAGMPKILLAHQPKNIYEAKRVGIDLQLSGHTHGGQYYPMQILSAIAQPYVIGLHNHEGTQIYVNRGVGYWGPPLRTGVPAEITRIRLTRAPAAA